MGAQPTGLIRQWARRAKAPAGASATTTRASPAPARFHRRRKVRRSGSPALIVDLVLLITLVFSSLNPAFLAVQCSRRGPDLRRSGPAPLAGSISPPGRWPGFHPRSSGVLWINREMLPFVAVTEAVATGAVVRYVYTSLRERYRMPSLVAMLRGLLTLLGMQLNLLGGTGPVNLPFASGLVKFGQILIMTRLAVVYAGYRTPCDDGDLRSRSTLPRNAPCRHLLTQRAVRFATRYPYGRGSPGTRASRTCWETCRKRDHSPDPQYFSPADLAHSAV